MPLCRYYRRKCGAAALSLCSYAPEKHSACVRQIRKALFFSTSLLNRVPVFKCVHLNSSSSSASHINTDTHTHGQRTHTHTVVPDFTAGSYSVMHLYHPSSLLPYRSAQNDRASTSIYISSLTPTCELQKAEDALASSRLLHLCPSRPLLSLSLLLLRLSKPPVFLQCCQSPKSWPR